MLAVSPAAQPGERCDKRAYKVNVAYTEVSPAAQPGECCDTTLVHMKLERTIDSWAAHHIAEIRVMFRRARIDLGLFDPHQANQRRKLHEINAGRDYRLPHPLFACPECGGPLCFEVDCWSPFFGMAHELRVMCSEEEDEWMRAFDSDEDPEWEHRHWQSDWQGVEDAVTRYVVRRCRVVEVAR
jgi:hypothetical protein